MPKIYLSGPMTGIKHYNAPAFNDAEMLFRAYNWNDIINPIKLDDPDPYTEEHRTGVWECKHRNRYLRRDLMLLADPQSKITHIYMLQGWEKSRGARLEKKIAEELGLHVVFQKKHGIIPPQVITPGSDDVGRKDDSDKLPWHLLPFDALEEVTKVLQFGAKKYEPRNWEKGMAWHRPFRAAINHLQHWWGGTKVDEETGLTPLAHAACEVLFLLAYELRQVGEDDRPGVVEKV